MNEPYRGYEPNPYTLKLMIRELTERVESLEEKLTQLLKEK